MSALLNVPHQERRNDSLNFNAFWELLTLAQKLALNKLNQYGYQLAFTRAESGTHLAVAQCDSSFATIDFEGEVNLNPTLTLR